MAGTERRTYRGAHPALGIASLALSVSSGVVFLMLVRFLEFLDRVTALSAGETDAPSLGLLVSSWRSPASSPPSWR